MFRKKCVFLIENHVSILSETSCKPDFFKIKRRGPEGLALCYDTVCCVCRGSHLLTHSRGGNHYGDSDIRRIWKRDFEETLHLHFCFEKTVMKKGDLFDVKKKKFFRGTFASNFIRHYMMRITYIILYILIYINSEFHKQ